MLAGGIVAVLAGIRFSVEGRRFDLLLSAGFFVAAASALVFEIVPVPRRPDPVEGRELGGDLRRALAMGLIAAAPFVRGSSKSRQRALGNAVAALLLLLAGLWLMLGTLGVSLPELATGPTQPDPPALLTVALSLQAVLSLVALVGFGLRYRNRGDDLSRWLGARRDAQPLLGALSRLRAAHAADLGLRRGLPARDRVRRAARRCLACDQRGRVRARRRGGTSPRRARHPRRSRAVPVRARDAREHARERQGHRRGDHPHQGAHRVGAAGSALRGARPVLRRRDRAVRRRASTVRGVSDGGRPPRGRRRDRPARRPRPRRADRGLPDRPGRARERAKARQRQNRGRADLVPRGSSARHRRGRRKRLRQRRRAARARACGTSASARQASPVRPRCGPSRAAAPRSRSRSAPSRARGRALYGALR